MSADERTASTPADQQATEVLSAGSTAVLPDQQPTEVLTSGSTAVLTDPAQEAAEGRLSSVRDEQTPFYGTPPVAPASSAPSVSAQAVSAPAASSTPPFSLTSLILGVASVFFGLTLIAPIAGIVFGVLGLRREPAGRTLAIWGLVLNAVSLGFVALMIIAMLFFGLLIPFIALASGSDIS